MLVIKAGIHRMIIKIANREGSDQKQSGLGLLCLSWPFGWQMPAFNPSLHNNTFFRL